MESPSAADFEEVADIALGLAEEIETDLTLEELAELMQAFCHHPVTVFARRICDLVPEPVEE